MLLEFEGRARTDLAHWKRHNQAIYARIRRLIEAIEVDPFGGIGKPEMPRDLADHWSRRITREHRLVYRVEADRIIVIQARGHY